MTVEEFINEWRNNSPFITAQTSGSTGAPKTIHLSKEFVRASAHRTNTFFSISSASRLHLPLSPDYIAGKMMIVRAIEANASLTCEPPSNTPTLNPNGIIDLLAVVPSQMDYLLTEKHNPVRNYLIGGSALSPDMKKRIAQARINAWESYGMTETASHIAIRPVKTHTTPFTTLPGIHCSLGENNNLVITMPRNTNHTDTLTVTTRDVAHLFDAHHFTILGRLDNTIITGGVKVHPEQVEAQLATLNWPFRYYITAVPDAKWTNRVALVIDTSSLENPDLYTDIHPDLYTDQHPDLYTDQHLLDAMRTILTGAHLPRLIVRLPSFRYTPSGKLLRSLPRRQ